MAWLLGDHKISCLGKGVSGTCDLYARRGSNSVYVVKTYHSKEKYESKSEYKERVLHEYNVLKDLNHINIIAVDRYSVSFSGLEIKVMLQAGSTRNLRRITRAAPHTEIVVTELLCFWRQVCAGVQYLHERHISHRDLKLDNVVVSSKTGHVKIIDFATAFYMGPDGTNDAVGLVGTEETCAPETYLRIKYDGKAADLWLLGIIFYYMMVRRHPWKAAHHSNKKYTEYVKDLDGYALSDEVPFDAHGILRKMLHPLPEMRATINQVLDDEWTRTIAYCKLDGECGRNHAETFHLNEST